MEQTVKQRLLMLIADLGIGQTKFEKICGLSNGYINNLKDAPTITVLQKIISSYPDTNLDWLVRGIGDMRNTGVEHVHKNEDVIMIPVISLDARGGFLPNDVSGSEYVDSFMPFSKEIAREGDFVIPIFGDSMAPKYPSGSCVLIRKVVLWMEYIEYGAAYVLDLVDDRRIIKNVQKSDKKDYYLLESVNPKYDPAEIPKNMIRNVFRVLVSVRRETI